MKRVEKNWPEEDMREQTPRGEDGWLEEIIME
jgi:hypothetical protein